MTYAGQTYGGSAYATTSYDVRDLIAEGKLSINSAAIISLDAVGLTTTEGETKTINSGTRAMVVQVNNSGELNIAGEINTTGTAAEFSSGRLSAKGDAKFTPVGDGLFIFGGQTKTVKTGEKLIAFEANLSGELNIDGTLNVDDTFPGVTSGVLTSEGDTDADPQRDEVVSGAATALGDAVPARIATENVIGTLKIESSASVLVAIPLKRADSFGVDYDDEESVALNAEQD